MAIRRIGFMPPAGGDKSRPYILVRGAPRFRGPHMNPAKRFAWGKGAAAEGVSFAAGGEAKDLELAATLSRCGLGAWPGR